MKDKLIATYKKTQHGFKAVVSCRFWDTIVWSETSRDAYVCCTHAHNAAKERRAEHLNGHGFQDEFWKINDTKTLTLTRG